MTKEVKSILKLVGVAFKVIAFILLIISTHQRLVAENLVFANGFILASLIFWLLESSILLIIDSEKQKPINTSILFTFIAMAFAVNLVFADSLVDKANYNCLLIMMILMRQLLLLPNKKKKSN